MIHVSSHSPHPVTLYENGGVQNEVDSIRTKSPAPSSDTESQQDFATTAFGISRPLSRSSVTSGLSITATKDGIEGNRVKRSGIPGYPLDMINQMYANQNRRVQPEHPSKNGQGSYTGSSVPSVSPFIMEDKDDIGSFTSLRSTSSMIPMYSRDHSLKHNKSCEDLSDYAESSSDVGSTFERESTPGILSTDQSQNIRSR